MGNKNISNQADEYKDILRDYSIIQSDKKEMLSYLEHKNSKQQYLLRTFNFSDQQIYLKELQILKRRAQILMNNQHSVKIQKIFNHKSEQYCMNLYKIYIVLEYPHRTLAHQIQERNKRKLHFNEKQIWSILASCILGLSHLQKHQIKHSALTTKNILFTTDGSIKLFDPHIVGQRSNYLTVYQERSSKNIYISPQELHIINEDSSNHEYNTFKSDIWVLGLIILQVGLLNSMMQCYREEYNSISWETLNFNLKLFQNNYSLELTNFIELMLVREQKERPTFLQLQKIMTNQEDSNKSCILNEVRSFQDLFIQSKCTDNKKTQHSIMPTQTILSAEVYNPLFSIDQSLVRFLPQNASSIQPSIPQSIHQSNIRHIMPVVLSSNISHTRPLRSIFPMNTYKTQTIIDDNVKVIEEISQRLTFQHSPNIIRQDNNNQLTKPLINNDNTKLQQIKSQNYNNLNIIYELHSKQQLNSFELSNRIKISPVKNNTIASSLQDNAQYIVEHYKQGSKYQGYKINKLKHGVGIYYYQDGGRYQGQWFMDKMQGNGKLYYQSGQLAYKGEWYNDKFLGKGVLYNDNPQIYKGAFNYHNFDEIEQYWLKYQGEFVDDMKNGWGQLYLTNGEMFEGYFQNDFIHGEGCYTTLDGSKVKGTWDTNLMV